MSDHTWTHEHIPACIMGGLSAAEMERVDAHAERCPECAAALADARAMDRGLQKLFAAVRPGPELEDEAVRSSRIARPRRLTFAHWIPRLAAAAVVLLGLCGIGAMANVMVSDGRLPMPGGTLVTADRAARNLAHLSLAILEQHSAVMQQAIDGSKSNDDAATQPKGVIAGKDESPRGTPDLNGTYSNQGISGGIGGGIGGGGGHKFSQGGGGISGGIQGGSGGQDFRRKDPTHFFGGYPQPVPTLPHINRLYSPPGQVNDFSPSRFVTGLTPLDPKDPQVVKQEPGGAPQPPATNKPPAAVPSEADTGAHRIVIRSGDMEFEVGSFEDSVATVTKIISGLNGAFVATVNSEKSPSGKVHGSITVRTPPEHLDRLVLELRRQLGAAGELKGMKLNSQDVTKQYTDLESRLRAARTMEQRLLQIIKEGKGEIKQLLEAEKELGVWRTKIEELEGEIRYYANLAALATLTISLAEKEARTPASFTENERVQAGVEVDDVDKAYQQTLLAVAEVKGRVAKSEVKQLSAGQFNASMQFEVPPEASGPIRDRLRQLGRVARLEIDRVQRAADGTPPADAKIKRGDTLFMVQIYNLANVAARETVTLWLAVPDVRSGYQALRDAASKTTGRVLAAQTNEQDAQNVTAQFDFDVRRVDEGGIRAALDAAGEVVSRQVTRAPESDDTTDTKVLYRISFLAANRLNPRETTTMTLEVADVEQASAAFAAQVAEAKGRQTSAQSARDQAGRVSARLIFEVPLAAVGIIERFKAAGIVRAHQSTQDSQAPAGKFATARFDLTLVNRDQIVAADDGLWPQIRRGLSYSMAVLLTSVTWVVFGLCVVLPWAVAIYLCFRLFRRLGAARRPLPAPSSTAG